MAFDQVHVEGIRRISALDIAFADRTRLPHQAAGHRAADRGRDRDPGASLHGAADRADRAGGWRVQRRGGRGRFRRPGDAGGPWRRRGPDRLGRGRRPDRHRAQPADAGVGRGGSGAVQRAVGADEQRMSAPITCA